MRNLLSPKAKVVVSATAPGTSRKAILTDSEEPWTGPSLPSYVHLTFPLIEDATHIAITFQGKYEGGFVGLKTEVWLASPDTEGFDGPEGGLRHVGNIYPEDKSRRQVFPLPGGSSGGLSSIASQGGGAQAASVDAGIEPEKRRSSELKLVFNESSDNQGRITVYQVEVLG